MNVVLYLFYIHFFTIFSVRRNHLVQMVEFLYKLKKKEVTYLSANDTAIIDV